MLPPPPQRSYASRASQSLLVWQLVVTEFPSTGSFNPEDIPQRTAQQSLGQLTDNIQAGLYKHKLTAEVALTRSVRSLEIAMLRSEGERKGLFEACLLLSTFHMSAFLALKYCFRECRHDSVAPTVDYRV